MSTARANAHKLDSNATTKPHQNFFEAVHYISEKQTTPDFTNAQFK